MLRIPVLYILLFAFATSVIALPSVKRIELHLGLNECVTCYAVLTNFSAIKNYEKMIVVSKQDSASASEFLEAYSISPDIKFKYVDKVVLGESYCLVYDGESKLDSFPFRMLPNKFYLKPKTTDKIQRLKLPPGFIINKSRVSVAVNGRSISYFDYALNKVIFLEFNQKFDSIVKVFVIKGSGMNTREFINSGRIDTAIYNSIFSWLKSVGKSDPHIESMFVNDTIMTLLLNFPSPRISGRNANDTIIDFGFFIYDKNLVNGKSTIKFVEHESLLNPYKFKYGIKNGRPIYRTKSGLHISITDFQKRDANINLLSQWKSTKTTYIFDRLNDISIDTQYYIKNEVENFFVNRNKDFYFNTILTMVLDINEGRIINSETIHVKGENQYALDLCKFNGKILMLIKSSGTTVELWTYDPTTDKITDKRPIDLPSDCDATNLKFCEDGNALIGMDNSTRMLIKFYFNN